MDKLDYLRNFYRSQGVPTILQAGYETLLEKAKQKNPKNILEIGTATGMSAIALASVTSAKITTIEIREKSYLTAKENFKEFSLTERITPLLGDSLEVIPSLKEKFDFVFLDGAKSKYLKNLLLIEPLLEKGALVVADNVLYRGYIEGKVPFVHRQKTIVVNMREYLKYVFQGGKYDSELVRKGDGISCSVYKG